MFSLICRFLKRKVERLVHIIVAMLWKLAIASATTLVGSAIATTVYSEGNDGRKVEAKHDQLLFVPRASSYMEIQDAVKKAEQLCLRLKEESGTPGLTISVTVDGKPVLNKGKQVLIASCYQFLQYLFRVWFG